MNFETFQKKNIDRCDVVTQSCKSALKELEGILTQQDVIVDTINNIYSQNTKILTRVINEIKESVIDIEAIADSLRSVEFADPAYKQEYDKLYERIANLMNTLNVPVPSRFESTADSSESIDIAIEEAIVPIDTAKEEVIVPTDTAKEEAIVPTDTAKEEAIVPTDIDSNVSAMDTDDFSDADIDAMFSIDDDNTAVQQTSPDTVNSSESHYKNNDEQSGVASDKLKALFNRANKLNF